MPLAFPDSVRKPLRRGWRGAPPNGVRATQMDSGPAKRRVESVAPGAPETIVYKVNEEQLGFIDGFYGAYKAERFDYDHPKWGEVEAEFVTAPEHPPLTGGDAIHSLTVAQLRLFLDHEHRHIGSALENREARLFAQHVEGIVAPLTACDLAPIDAENGGKLRPGEGHGQWLPGFCAAFPRRNEAKAAAT